MPLMVLAIWQLPIVINIWLTIILVPEINLKTADTILWPINTAYIAVEPTVKDNYYNTSQITLTKTSNVNAYKLGLYFDEYTATDGSGNVSVLRRYVKIVDAQAGIAVLEKNQGVNVYPNPSSGKFNIIYKSDLQEDLAIEVYNVTGKLVAVIKGDNGKNGTTVIGYPCWPVKIYCLGQ
jgi:hypothetical protein